ncbi:hypothetical protein NECHADRAFT_77323 [Paecilomyces variotii No. 5]|uniref:OsmC/Ohr family n=1 Tax=Byssochlamys spectabilis (strain No. 5 / NBRC 109023) TaxID=1356009 RepID=V5G8P4_BYSSN|nr:hypothetical protein NECHADRAFT_77323 [Paecilomyces variotii No. 5]
MVVCTQALRRQGLAILRSSPHTSSYRLFSQSPRSLNKFSVRVSGTGRGVAQNIKADGHPHLIQTDAYTFFEGHESAPTPLVYNLSSLGSCTQVAGSLVAKSLGAKLGEWNVAVKGNLDTGVLAEGKEGNGNWEGIEVDVRVQTDIEDRNVFSKFVSETERRCPIMQLFKQSGTNLKSTWVNEKL